MLFVPGAILHVFPCVSSIRSFATLRIVRTAKRMPYSLSRFSETRRPSSETNSSSPKVVR